MSKDITAMQDLKEDLILTIDGAKEALKEIENDYIRLTCQYVVELTLKSIIKRIDDELLEIERQQIVMAFWNSKHSLCEENTNLLYLAEEYYKAKYKN